MTFAVLDSTKTNERPKLLRCRDVHGVRCEVEWTGQSVGKLVAAAIEHGMTDHGFTAAFYSSGRVAAIRRAMLDD